MLPMAAAPQPGALADEGPAFHPAPVPVAPPALAPVPVVAPSVPRPYEPAPVPAPSTVNTPVYDEMVAEWAAFGRYWPGADQYADATAPAYATDSPTDPLRQVLLPHSESWH